MYNNVFSLGSTIRCCHNCNSRRSGCHSTCDKYIAEKVNNDGRLKKEHISTDIMAHRQELGKYCDKHRTTHGRSYVSA